MAHTEEHDSDDVIATINIVPFVDVVLVLLVIFMVTSAAILRASYEVDLPKAAAAGEAVDSPLNIVVTAAGELFVNGDSTSREQLGEQVRAQSALDRNLQAVIAADKKVDYGAVMGVIDLVKQNGVTAFALNIERIESSAAQTAP